MTRKQTDSDAATKTNRWMEGREGKKTSAGRRERRGMAGVCVVCIRVCMCMFFFTCILAFCFCTYEYVCLCKFVMLLCVFLKSMCVCVCVCECEYECACSAGILCVECVITVCGSCCKWSMVLLTSTCAMFIIGALSS